MRPQWQLILLYEYYDWSGCMQTWCEGILCLVKLCYPVCTAPMRLTYVNCIVQNILAHIGTQRSDENLIKARTYATSDTNLLTKAVESSKTHNGPSVFSDKMRV